MSEPGCCASFCGGIWNKIREGKLKTSARMVAFLAIVGMLACSIAVGFTDCNVATGIIGVVTTLFLIVCEVRVTSFNLNIFRIYATAGSVYVRLRSRMCHICSKNGFHYAELHFERISVYWRRSCKQCSSLHFEPAYADWLILKHTTAHNLM